MVFIPREQAFACEHCGAPVKPLGKGTYRDHCPLCFFSKHVDQEGPGDRSSKCKGLMKPTTLDQDSKKGFVIHYECLKCGKTAKNRAAPDDHLTEFPKKLSEDQT